MLFTTANVRPENYEAFEEIVVCASMTNLELGNRISPQLPLMIVVDIIYDYFMELDRQLKGTLFSKTLSAIDKEGDINYEEI